MTEQYSSTPKQFIPSTIVPPKKKGWRIQHVAAAWAIGLLVGGILGTANRPAPVETVKEVPGPERVVTKSVEVPVTPAECITALDLASDAIGTLAEVGSLASDGVMAAYNRNGPVLESITAKVSALNKKITDATPAVGAATQACRASAK